MNVTDAPSMAPTFAPTFAPTTLSPTFAPTTPAPTFSPPPTLSPTLSPTFSPTLSPTTASYAASLTWHSEYTGAVLTEYAAILWTILLLLVYLTIRHYADRKLFRAHTYATVGLAYFCAFGIIVLVSCERH